MNATISVIIPVFNEEDGIPALLERLQALVASLGSTTAEVLFVDDHSSDGSSGLLKAFCAGYPGFSYLRLARNSGSHIAILAGLAHARGGCAVFLAADLQDPPELIPQMLELWRAGQQIVWAVRARREGISWFARLLSNTFYYLLNVLGEVSVPPTGADFALLDRKVVDALLASAGTNPSLIGEIARLGFLQAQIPYTKEARAFGHSKWKLKHKLKAFADAFVSFSYAPLRAMSYLGFLSSFVGLGYAAVIIVLRLTARVAIAGWASLMVVVLLLGGVQMIMLGILGEYLWRTLDAARRRPNYFVEDSAGLLPEAERAPASGPGKP